MQEQKKVVPLHPQNDASVAQLVEHLTLNQGVQGSTPCGSTKNSRCQAAFFVLHDDFMMIEYELHLLLVFF